jgi:putative alpha-1,2-mannosidase
MGMYPGIPGRAELLLSSPLFSQVVVHRAAGDVRIDVERASADARYIDRVSVNGKAHAAPYLPESLVRHGARMAIHLSATPDTRWGSDKAAAPPSFAPR